MKSRIFQGLGYLVTTDIKSYVTSAAKSHMVTGAPKQEGVACVRAHARGTQMLVTLVTTYNLYGYFFGYLVVT